MSLSPAAPWGRCRNTRQSLAFLSGITRSILNSSIAFEMFDRVWKYILFQILPCLWRQEVLFFPVHRSFFLTSAGDSSFIAAFASWPAGQKSCRQPRCHYRGQGKQCCNDQYVKFPVHDLLLAIFLSSYADSCSSATWLPDVLVWYDVTMKRILLLFFMLSPALAAAAPSLMFELRCMTSQCNARWSAGIYLWFCEHRDRWPVNKPIDCVLRVFCNDG